MNNNKPRVGFAFSSKDRVELSRRSLRSIDSDPGFDLIWIDGSTSEEGRRLPESTHLRNARLVEVHLDVKGGPDAAIRYGLRRLLALGYDYCGLIENDIEFVPGWFSRLMELFKFGEVDHVQVGAATARTFVSRALAIQSQYARLWNIGAGMVLFTRRAARIILRHYHPRRSRDLSDYFGKGYDNDLEHIWELWMDKHDRWLGCDWGYALELDKRGLASLGTVPSFSFNLDLDPKTFSRSDYLGGIAGTASEVPLMTALNEFLLQQSADKMVRAPADRSLKGKFHEGIILAQRLYWKLRLPMPIWLMRRIGHWFKR